MNPVKQILLSVIQERIPEQERRVALLLSGGIDSLALGFALEHAGKQVIAYTFQIEDNESEDSLTAADACARFGWEFNLIKVPTDNLESDFIRLARHYKCDGKARHECTFPMLYTIPAIKQRFILTGLGADSWCGLSKEAMIHHIDTKAKFDAWRREIRAEKDPGGGQPQLEQLCREHGRKTILFPFLDERMSDYMMWFNWKQINKPKQKQKYLDAFPEEFSQVKIRKHANYQLVAGVPAVYERLLKVPAINVMNRTRVMDMCRDWKIANPARQLELV